MWRFTSGILGYPFMILAWFGDAPRRDLLFAPIDRPTLPGIIFRYNAPTVAGLPTHNLL